MDNAILDTNVITKVSQKPSRNELIENLLFESTGAKSRFSSDQLTAWGGTENSLKKQIEKIVENNEKFQSVADFVDFAIEMQLIWWGAKPELMHQRLDGLIVTEPQIKYKQHYDSLIEEEILKRTEITQDESFDKFQSNILKYYGGELQLDEIERDKNLIYDTYPMLWKYYSRLLPIKATLHIISFIAQENDKPYFELSEKNLDLAFQLLTNVGDILTEYDEAVSLKRNEKIGTGFPSQKETSDVKTKIGSSAEEIKTKIAKMESVKNRFKSHLIGKKSTDAVFDRLKEHAEENQPNTNQEQYERFLKDNLEELILKINEQHNISLKIDKQDWNNMKEEFNKSVKITKNKLKDSRGSFQGALNALDLVVPYYDEDTAMTRLYISSNGYKFLKIQNPVLSGLKLIEHGIQEIKNASKKEKLKKTLDWKQFTENIFSEEEVGFILEEIIPRKLNLEQNIIAEIISRLIDKDTLSATNVEELIAGVCLSWGYQNPEGFLTHKIDEHVANYFEYDTWSVSGKRVLTGMPEDIARGGEKERKKWQVKKKEEITSLRMATMGRLSEMGVVEWKMKEGGSAEYSKGMHFDRVKHMKLMTRKEMIARRDDWKKFY